MTSLSEEEWNVPQNCPLNTTTEGGACAPAPTSISQTEQPFLPAPGFSCDFTVYTVFCLHVCLRARRENQISLQVVVSQHVVLGIELKTSGRAASALNPSTISPAPPPTVLIFKLHGLSCFPWDVG